MCISDRQKGIKAASQQSLPDTRLADCCRHLCDNARKLSPHGWLDNDFWAVQSQVTEAAFKSKLDLLAKKNAKVAAYIAAVPHEEWALYAQIKAGTKMYGYSTSSFVESENARLLPIRHEAPLRALHKTVMLMSKQANKAREDAIMLKAGNKLLTSFAEVELSKETRLAATCTVQRVDNHTALVKSSEGTDSIERIVNFEDKTCSCCEWQQTGRPCRHAIAFARSYYGRDFETDPEVWIKFGWDSCYLAENYIKAVIDSKVLPPNMEELFPDEYTKPAKVVKGPGRPRKKRIRCAADHQGFSRATGRPAKKVHCSRCGKEGHYVATCTAAPDFSKLQKFTKVPN